MATALEVNICLKLVNKPGMLAQVLAVIAAKGGNLGSIDVKSVASGHVVRELTVGFSDNNDLAGLLTSLEEIPGVEVEKIIDRV